MTRIAIALERHRLATGSVPETLDALRPRFLEKIPHDIINGKPMNYRRMTDDQFVLYSVGWNSADDGGAVFLEQEKTLTKVNIRQGDWVWKYPTN